MGRMRAENDMAVVAAQVVIDGEDALGFQLEEHGIDELHHVVLSPSGQQHGHLRHQRQSAQLALASCQIQVAGIVFPEVAVAGHGNLMAQGA